jgi:hypothetical protein
MGPFHLMSGRRFPARIVDGKLTPMLVSQQDFEECCCVEIPEYIRIWNLTLKTRHAVINADGSWSYSSECVSNARSTTHGLGAKFVAASPGVPAGWYYDNSVGNPFGQATAGYLSQNRIYISSESSSPPGQISTDYCYSPTGGTVYSSNVTIRPTCLFSTIYSQENEPMKWYTRWQINGANFTYSPKRPFSNLEPAGPVGTYDHAALVNSTLPGFTTNGVYPANDVQYDQTVGGVRTVGGFSFAPPIVTAATF